MADEPTEQVPAQEPTTPVEPQTPEPEPHPLAEGGVRFNEIYARMKESERREAAANERIARLEGAQSAQQKPAAQTPNIWTNEQLQQAVDQGRITQATMADQIAWQRGQQLEQSLQAKFEQRDRQRSALSEVESFIEKVPKLRDATSEEFGRVARNAREIASDLGRDAGDPIVQRLALRATFGPLDKIAAVRQTQDFARQHAETFSEAGNGGNGQRQTQQAGADPLKDVPKEYLDHWKEKKYTREQMIAEAKYITRTPRKVVGGQIIR